VIDDDDAAPAPAVVKGKAGGKLGGPGGGLHDMSATVLDQGEDGSYKVLVKGATSEIEAEKEVEHIIKANLATKHGNFRMTRNGASSSSRYTMPPYAYDVQDQGNGSYLVTATVARFAPGSFD
jgi:hypothetical protein